MPTIAVVTLDGFNEVDSFVSSYMLGRVNRPCWRVAIACPTPQVTSMNGVIVSAQMSLDPAPQLTGSQCSGALLLAKLGLLDGVPVCTDLITRPWVIARLADLDAAREALFYVAPVGEKDEYVDRALRHVRHFESTPTAS